MASINPMMTGAFGAVSVDDVVAGAIQNWTFQEANTSVPIINSATRGGTSRQEGLRDWNGTFVSENALPILFPGDSFEFIGYTFPTSGARGGAGPTRKGQAYLESLQVVINWATNDPVRNTYTFSGNGTWEETDEIVTDTTNPQPIMSRQVTPVIAPIPSSATAGDCWLNGTTMTLTFNRPSASTTNTCTIDQSSGAPIAFVTRQPGNTIDCTATFNADSIPIGFFPATNVAFTLKLLWGTELGWDINWMKKLNATGLTVDLTQNTILNQAFNLEWDAYPTTEAESGYIKCSGKTYWPE